MRRALTWVAVAATILFCLFPFYWLINTSLKTGADLSSANLLPPSPTLDNYTSIFEDTAFTKALRNSGKTLFRRIGISTKMPQSPYTTLGIAARRLMRNATGCRITSWTTPLAARVSAKRANAPCQVVRSEIACSMCRVYMPPA